MTALLVFCACHGQWEPFAWAIGVPATVFALAWGWKHSGLTFDSVYDAKDEK